MSILDLIFLTTAEHERAKSLAAKACARHGQKAERSLTDRLTRMRGRARRIMIAAIDEANWRNCKDWLPDMPAGRPAA